MAFPSVAKVVNLLTAPFLLFVSIPLASFAIFTTTIAFATLLFRVSIVYVELALAVIQSAVESSTNILKHQVDDDDEVLVFDSDLSFSQPHHARRRTSSSSSTSSVGSLFGGGSSIALNTTAPLANGIKSASASASIINLSSTNPAHHNRPRNSLSTSSSRLGFGGIEAGMNFTPTPRDYESVGGWHLTVDDEEEALWMGIGSKLEISSTNTAGLSSINHNLHSPRHQHNSSPQHAITSSADRQSTGGNHSSRDKDKENHVMSLSNSLPRPQLHLPILPNRKFSTAYHHVKSPHTTLPRSKRASVSHSTSQSTSPSIQMSHHSHALTLDADDSNAVQDGDVEDDKGKGSPEPKAKRLSASLRSMSSNSTTSNMTRKSQSETRLIKDGESAELDDKNAQTTSGVTSPGSYFRLLPGDDRTMPVDSDESQDKNTVNKVDTTDDHATTLEADRTNTKFQHLPNLRINTDSPRDS